MTTPHRAAIRAEMRAQRRALNVTAQQAAARQIARALWRIPAIIAARDIALYFPVRGEIDLRVFALQAEKRGRRVFLPVVRGTQLRFARWTPGQPLKRNRFGIPEPAVSPAVLRSATRLRVVIAPALAVDWRGNRLGSGAGFYDRTLARLGRVRGFRKPVLIVAVHEFQVRDALEPESWDIRADWVATDHQARPTLIG